MSAAAKKPQICESNLTARANDSKLSSLAFMTPMPGALPGRPRVYAAALLDAQRFIDQLLAVGNVFGEFGV
jgi:hypothetical protein